MAKKISELDFQSSFQGDEDILLAVNDSNKRTDLDTLKRFFGDSACKVFSEVITDDVTVINGAPSEEDNAIIDIVYLTTKRKFVARKTQTIVSYFDTYAELNEFMHEGTPRTDRVFFCVEDKGIYIYNGELKSVLESVRIHAMTEDELANLENPIEGAFYATYEE